METHSIKQLITSLFHMPGSRGYTVRVRNHRCRPPGSRRRYVGSRYPGGNILRRSDLASYVPLLRQNGLLPGAVPVPRTHLEHLDIAIPEFGHQTFPGTAVLILPFVFPPARVEAGVFEMIVFESFIICWSNRRDGYMYFGVCDSDGSDRGVTVFRCLPADTPPISGQSFWFCSGSLDWSGWLMIVGDE
jgi:hypothetical protein